MVVLDNEGRTIGILTDRDIAVRAVAEGRDPASVTIEEICSRDLVTIEPDMDAAEAARLMRERSVRRLPVTDDGKPVGMISIGDLAIERDPDSAARRHQRRQGQRVRRPARESGSTSRR